MDKTYRICKKWTHRTSLMRFSFGSAVGLLKSVINFILLLTANWVADKAGETALL